MNRRAVGPSCRSAKGAVTGLRTLICFCVGKKRVDNALLTFRSFGHSPGRDWGPLDLFGCDRDRPFSRIDNAGLLWLLTGNRLGGLSENAAEIETPSGGRQPFRRRAMVADRVAVAWELAGIEGRDEQSA